MKTISMNECQLISGATVTMRYSHHDPRVVTITIDNADDMVQMGHFTFTRDNCYFKGEAVNSAEYNIVMKKHDKDLFWWHSWTEIQFIKTGKYL